MRISGLRKTSTIAAVVALALAVSGCGQGKDAEPEAETVEAGTETGNPELASDNITDASFGCISDLTKVDRFFVGNLDGHLDATVKVAENPNGGVYPVGSVVQLVPQEVMVKRAKGYNPKTKDWEFFELTFSGKESKIGKRGADDVVNQFGGNCLECHEKAKPQFDLVCKTDRGCDPIPLTEAMIRGIQKTDPRCEPQELTAEEAEAMKLLQEVRAAQGA